MDAGYLPAWEYVVYISLEMLSFGAFSFVLRHEPLLFGFDVVWYGAVPKISTRDIQQNLN